MTFYPTVVMDDVIKMEPEVDPLSIQTSDDADIEEKKPLSEEGNLLDLHVTEIKTEFIDHKCDLKSEMTYEEAAVSVDFPMRKSEAENNSREVDGVKEEVKLEVTSEENEVLTESVPVSHNSGISTLSENLPQGEEVHTVEKKYDCDVCGRFFPDSARLKRHGLVHKYEKKFSCEVCGKCFFQSEVFEKHSIKHKSEKRFICRACGMCFSKSKYLKSHLRVHTDEKTFSCDVCGKGFSFSANLERHSRVHRDSKPFRCDVCGKCFAWSNNLARHSSLHRDEKKSFSCDGCGIFRYAVTRTYRREAIQL
ncbi:zinc finger protein 235-like isoform X5 [Periplaneta americana]|uniref:zinc finger protein 235-like isoform X5 n=1 Tax=Periplaneta americana TaxID=6978 RepID=UPI0037E95048